MSPFPGTPQLPEVTGKPLRDNAFPSRRHHIAAPRRALAAAGLAVALACPCRLRRPPETERKLQKLRTELKGVAQERRQIEGSGQASQQLREADEKVARTGRALAQTEAALREQAQALAQAEQRRSSLQTNLAQQHRELAGCCARPISLAITHR
jgi:septal ring factor EnvC (AmiA/AmiB activator)